MNTRSDKKAVKSASCNKTHTHRSVMPTPTEKCPAYQPRQLKIKLTQPGRRSAYRMKTLPLSNKASLRQTRNCPDSPVILWKKIGQPATNCNRRFFNGFRLCNVSLLTYQKSQKIPLREVTKKRDLLWSSETRFMSPWERGAWKDL